MRINPDISRFLMALRGSEPDRVPLSEFLVDPPVKEAFLGQPVGNALLGGDDYDVTADIEFWHKAGYDYLHLAPFYLHLFTGGWITSTSAYSVYSDEPVEKSWMEEHRSLIATREEFERYPWPNLDDVQYDHLERAASLLPAGMGLTSGTWGILETSRALMGFETMCYLLHDDSALVEAVIERVGNFLFTVFQRVAAMSAVSALWFADDIAHAQGFIFDPTWLRRVLFPWMRRYGEVAQAAGKPLIYHCDGAIWEVIPDIIEAGVSALQPIEPKAMDIVEVKRRYGRQLCLIGNIDLGSTLTRGTPEQVRAEVRQHIRALAPGGGYCVGSSNSITNYVPLANYRAMIEATFEFGRYPIRG